MALAFYKGDTYTTGQGTDSPTGEVMVLVHKSAGWVTVALHGYESSS